MAIALEQGSSAPASAREVSEWLQRVAGATLAERAARVAEIESGRVAASALGAQEGDSSAVRPYIARVEDEPAPTVASPRAKRGRAFAIAGVAAAVIAATGLGLAARRHEAPRPRERTDTGGVPTGVASEAPAPVLDASSTAVAPTPPVTPPPPSTSKLSPGGPRRAKPSADCSPPFSWDAQGKKHYKAQCL